MSSQKWHNDSPLTWERWIWPWMRCILERLPICGCVRSTGASNTLRGNSTSVRIKV